jgi:hypothetical protein
LKVIFVPVLSVSPMTASGPRAPAAILLEVDVPLALDLHLEPLAHGVHRADADAVQTRADLVARVVELPAGVEHGHHDLGRAHAALPA